MAEDAKKSDPARAELDAAKALADAEAKQAAYNDTVAQDAVAKQEAEDAAAREVKSKELAKLAQQEAASGRALAEMNSKGSKPVSANPAALEWPTDIHQATSALKKAIIETGARVNGQPDKLEAVLAVMSIGMKHIRARFDEQVKTNKESADWRAKKEAERQALTIHKGWSPT
jgi:hypothetical protein